MINLQKTFFVIGAFSFFEALIQNNLNCKNGFEEAKNILKNNNDSLLSEKFEEAQDIINVLKHGRGRSYDKLLNKANRVINIKIKGENDFYFNEENVDEINSLIEVDDNFILEMSEIISETTEAIYKYTHIYF